MKVSIAMQTGNESTAENLFKKAQTLKLPTDNERAMVQLQLAGIHLKKNNWNKVKTIMRKVKDFDVTEPTIQSQIDQIQLGLKNRGALNPSNMRQAQQMGRSRKRRRQKMR